MKTTIDIPDDLFREIKIQSVRDGRKLKETMADLLRRGLAATAGITSVPPAEIESANLRLRRHILDRTDTAELDNAAIDADLARAYSDCHSEEPALSGSKS